MGYEIKKTRKKIPEKKRCLGRKIDGLRCSRSKLPEYDFCKSHVKSLSNGRIDDGLVFTPKISKSYKNNEDYICVHKRKINGQTFFIDEKNYVYINNLDEPERIGVYTGDKIDFFVEGGPIVI